MAGTISNLDNNLAEEIQKNKCKFEHDDKNVKLAEIKTHIGNIFLNTKTLKMISKNTNIYAVKRVIQITFMKT